MFKIFYKILFKWAHVDDDGGSDDWPIELPTVQTARYVTVAAVHFALAENTLAVDNLFNEKNIQINNH